MLHLWCRELFYCCQFSLLRLQTPAADHASKIHAPRHCKLTLPDMTTGGQVRGSEGGRWEGGRRGREEVREGVGETGEKERKEKRGIRAKKDGTQTK